MMNIAEYKTLYKSCQQTQENVLIDIIKVEGFTGTTPNIVFVSKSTDTTNLFGKKNFSDKIVKVVDIINNTDVAVKQWRLVADKDN